MSFGFFFHLFLVNCLCGDDVRGHLCGVVSGGRVMNCDFSCICLTNLNIFWGCKLSGSGKNLENVLPNWKIFLYVAYGFHKQWKIKFLLYKKLLAFIRRHKLSKIIQKFTFFWQLSESAYKSFARVFAKIQFYQAIATGS